MNKKFNVNDLKICDWQYAIKHTNVNTFICGEKVFLKSNPEHPMFVHSINENNITTMWYDDMNNEMFSDFPPECVLQYKYAAMKIWNDKFIVFLN